jgi:hypothetical protein
MQPNSFDLVCILISIPAFVVCWSCSFLQYPSSLKPIITSDTKPLTFSVLAMLGHAFFKSIYGPCTFHTLSESFVRFRTVWLLHKTAILLAAVLLTGVNNISVLADGMFISEPPCSSWEYDGNNRIRDDERRLVFLDTR